MQNPLNKVLGQHDFLKKGEGHFNFKDYITTEGLCA